MCLEISDVSEMFYIRKLFEIVRSQRVNTSEVRLRRMKSEIFEIARSVVGHGPYLMQKHCS
jgi:hypothetical protein